MKRELEEPDDGGAKRAATDGEAAAAPPPPVERPPITSATSTAATTTAITPAIPGPSFARLRDYVQQGAHFERQLPCRRGARNHTLSVNIARLEAQPATR